MPNQHNPRPEKAHSDAKISNLPMRIAAAGPYRSTKKINTAAHFLIHLLAEKQQLPVQRARRRVSVPRAVGAYQSGILRATPRLPAGFVCARIA